jgi:predicted ester cyclase
MDTNNVMSQIDFNKAAICRYLEAYNNKNETIFDDMISSDYVDHGQPAYVGSSGLGVAVAKHEFKISLDKLEAFHYEVETMIASAGYSDLVGTYWKRSLTLKAMSDIPHANKTISYRGTSIYRIQNGKMVESWHVVEGLPSIQISRTEERSMILDRKSKPIDVVGENNYVKL